MKFMDRDFLLHNDTARTLYHGTAAELPIIDYHCHLDPRQIAEDHTFADPFELFLGGDHYKWRQMRTAGIPEEEITGSTDPYRKFLGFAAAMPKLIGNPLYHWTHLELQRYFDISEPLCADSAERIWDICSGKLKEKSFSAKNLILRSNVETVCTTDDPASDLRWHKTIRESGFAVKVLPTFRPDAYVEIGKPDFPARMESVGVTDLAGLLSWLDGRIAYFDEAGCRLADHGVSIFPYAEGDADAALRRRLAGQTLTDAEADAFRTAVMAHCAKQYALRGWTMQLHIGALRNNSTRLFRTLGPDVGCDSIDDRVYAEKLSRFLDLLDRDGLLPQTILYPLNARDYAMAGAMIGNFQSAPVAGKLQLGAAWWFGDNRDGMEQQLRTLGNLGMLGTFVGMLTDSRSFVSYPRHEYFRRIFCNLVGTWVEDGEYPADEAALTELVRGVCYANAKAYFRF